MTQNATVDPFAAAQVATATPASAAPTATPAPAGSPATDPLAGAYGDDGSSMLFGEGASAPALFNKTHFLGSERSGIVEKSEARHDRDYTAKMPKYWSTSKVGGEQKNRAITTDPIDGPTGQPNRPVMVTHVTLRTDYRMSEIEVGATGRDSSFIETDDGTRVEVIGGLDLKVFREAIADARKRGILLTSAADLIGKRLTVKRAAQKPNPHGGNPSWIKSYRIDKA